MDSQKVFDVLDQLEIQYDILNHPAVFTVEQARVHEIKLEGAHCKNLFLRNPKGDRHYLVIIEDSSMADLKALSEIVGEKRLSFASPERLKKYLGLEPGAVSAFGLINDGNREVMVLIDDTLEAYGKISFHPNINTQTLTIQYSDFMRYIEWLGSKWEYVTIGTRTMDC